MKLAQSNEQKRELTYDVVRHALDEIDEDVNELSFGRRDLKMDSKLKDKFYKIK